MVTIPTGRLTPRGLAEFLRCAYAQRRHLRQTWPESFRIAWRYGPVR